MSEKKCKYCSLMIPADARICPHCRKTQGLTYAQGCLVIIIAIVLIPILLYLAGTSSNSPAPSDPYSAARGACRMAIKQSLHDPGSADFDLGSSWYTETQKNGAILVQPKLRSKNAFGAYIYATYNCIVKHEGGNVRVLSLKQIQP